MVKFLETKNRMVVAGPCMGEEIEKLLFSGCSVSVWEDKNVLEWMVVMAVNNVNLLNATELYT